MFYFEAVVFRSVDESGAAIYHTNVMMWIGTKAAGVCFESVVGEKGSTLQMSDHIAGYQVAKIAMSMKCGEQNSIPKSNSSKFPQYALEPK